MIMQQSAKKFACRLICARIVHQKFVASTDTVFNHCVRMFEYAELLLCWNKQKWKNGHKIGGKKSFSVPN